MTIVLPVAVFVFMTCLAAVGLIIVIRVATLASQKKPWKYIFGEGPMPMRPDEFVYTYKVAAHDAVVKLAQSWWKDFGNALKLYADKHGMTNTQHTFIQDLCEFVRERETLDTSSVSKTAAGIRSALDERKEKVVPPPSGSSAIPPRPVDYVPAPTDPLDGWPTNPQRTGGYRDRGLGRDVKKAKTILEEIEEKQVRRKDMEFLANAFGVVDRHPLQLAKGEKTTAEVDENGVVHIRGENGRLIMMMTEYDYLQFKRHGDLTEKFEKMKPAEVAGAILETLGHADLEREKLQKRIRNQRNEIKRLLRQDLRVRAERDRARDKLHRLESVTGDADEERVVVDPVIGAEAVVDDEQDLTHALQEDDPVPPRILSTAWSSDVKPEVGDVVLALHTYERIGRVQSVMEDQQYKNMWHIGLVADPGYHKQLRVAVVTGGQFTLAPPASTPSEVQDIVHDDIVEIEADGPVVNVDDIPDVLTDPLEAFTDLPVDTGVVEGADEPVHQTPGGPDVAMITTVGCVCSSSAKVLQDRVDSSFQIVCHHCWRTTTWVATMRMAWDSWVKLVGAENAGVLPGVSVPEPRWPDRPELTACMEDIEDAVSATAMKAAKSDLILGWLKVPEWLMLALKASGWPSPSIMGRDIVVSGAADELTALLYNDDDECVDEVPVLGMTDTDRGMKARLRGYAADVTRERLALEAE